MDKKVSIDPDLQRERKSYTMPSILILMYALAFSVAIPAFPATTLIICNYDSSRSAYIYGIGMTIRYVTETIFSPLIGTVSDVAGRRTVLLMSYVCGGLEFLAMGLAPSIEMLFICRMLTGIGDSGVSTAYAIFSDIAIFNKDNLSVTFGRVAATVIIAFVAGPVLGGWISDTYSPSACLLTAAVLTALAFVSAYILLEETLGYNGVNNSDKMIYLRTGKYPAVADETESGDGTDNHSTTSGASRSSNSNTGISMKDPNSRDNTSSGDLTIPDMEICRAMFDSDEEDEEKEKEKEKEKRREEDGMGGDVPEHDNSGVDSPGDAYALSQVGCLRWCPLQIASSTSLQWLTRFFIISNPWPSIKFHFSKVKLRQLVVPIFISNLCSGGLISIWYIYLDYKFKTTSMEVGYYLSVMALATAFTMGYFLPAAVPHWISEKKAITYGYMVASLQFVILGWAPKYGFLFLSLLFILGTIADPTLLGMIVKQSMLGETVSESSSRQGNLQGTLSSVKTLASAIGSTVFSRLLSAGVEMEPAKPWIPFVLAFILFNTCAIYIGVLFSSKSWKYAPNTGSRLSKDAPTDRPMRDDDFDEGSVHQADRLRQRDDANDGDPEAPLLSGHP